MDHDIKSQIKRAKELLRDLEESCNTDLKKKSVSERTKNLTQEVLTKMRHVLDQSMRRFFEKIIAPDLSPNEKDKVKVYFPIAGDRAGLKSTLGRAKMANLETSHPNVFNFLESVQPYNDDYAWLNDFSKFANEKHIRLSPQEIKEESETTLGNAVRVSGKKVAMRGVSIQGIPVNSEDINSTPLDQFDTRLQVKRTTWVSFNFKGSSVNALWLCKKAVNELDKLINDFFSKF